MALPGWCWLDALGWGCLALPWFRYTLDSTLTTNSGADAALSQGGVTLRSASSGQPNRIRLRERAAPR